ncbi:hypothetical protein RCL1_003579 [Eukaryota sp. TZLM3-RCL]
MYNELPQKFQILLQFFDPSSMSRFIYSIPTFSPKRARPGQSTFGRVCETTEYREFLGSPRTDGDGKRINKFKFIVQRSLKFEPLRPIPHREPEDDLETVLNAVTNLKPEQASLIRNLELRIPNTICPVDSPEESTSSSSSKKFSQTNTQSAPVDNIKSVLKWIDDMKLS